MAFQLLVPQIVMEGLIAQCLRNNPWNVAACWRE